MRVKIGEQEYEFNEVKFSDIVALHEYQKSQVVKVATDGLSKDLDRDLRREVIQAAFDTASKIEFMDEHMQAFMRDIVGSAFLIHRCTGAPVEDVMDALADVETQDALVIALENATPDIPTKGRKKAPPKKKSRRNRSRSR